MIGYTETANALVERIEALVGAQPQILALTSAYGLFDVPGFACDDLQPSLAQASAALAQVQACHRRLTL